MAVVVLHIACLPGLVLTDLPAVARLVGLFIVCVSAWRARRQLSAGVGWHFLPGPPPELDDGQGRRAIVDAALAGSAVWLTWMDDEGRRGRLMLLADSFASTDHWRRVRVVLRHGLERPDSVS